MTVASHKSSYLHVLRLEGSQQRATFIQKHTSVYAPPLQQVAAGSLGAHSHDWLVILGPGDDSGWAGLHFADEGGVVVQQDVHGLQ